MPDLRLLLADAYRDAALAQADMTEAVHALEAVRASASGPEPGLAAETELLRQLGLVRSPGVAAALGALEPALDAALLADDRAFIMAGEDEAVRATRVRQRLARTLVAWRVARAERLVATEFPLGTDARAALAGFRPILRAITLGSWQHAHALFAALRDDDALEPAERACFEARLALVYLYIDRDLTRARAALEGAERRMPASAPASRRAELRCVRGQYHMERGGAEERARAVAAFTESIALDPTLEEPYAYLGDCAWEDPSRSEAERGRQAEEWYLRGMAESPGGTMNVLRLAKLLGRPEQYPARRLRVAALREQALRVGRDQRAEVLVTFAGVARENGELDAAADLLRDAIADAPERQDVHYADGELRLLREDLPGALAAFARAAAADPGTYDDYDWSVLADAAHPDALLAAATATPPSAIAATALGTIVARRAALEASRDEAIALGERLRDALGAHATAGFLAGLAEAYGHVARWDDAEAASAAAFALDGRTGAEPNRLSLLHNRRGNRAYEAGDFAEAERWYRRALERRPEDPVLHGNLADALERVTETEPTLARFEEAIAHYREAIALGGDTPDVDYPPRLERVRARRALFLHSGRAAVAHSPGVLPIEVDVGPALLPLVADVSTGELVAECHATVARVRDLVRDTWGVLLPGIRFRRGPDDAGADRYVISLDGLPVVAGDAPASLVLHPGAPRPEHAEAAQPAPEPLTGLPAYWIAPALVDPARGVGARPPLEVILRHAAWCFLRDARTTIGLDDVAALCTRDGSQDALAVADDPPALLRLTRMVRILVSEGVPVLAMAALAELARHPEGRSVAALVEAARKRPGVRERLPGNLGARTPVTLAPEHERLLRAGLHLRDEEPALALPPEECQTILAAMREQIERHERPVVMVADDLRPCLRWLLEIEHPRLPVLGVGEYSPAEASPRHAEVAWVS